MGQFSTQKVTTFRSNFGANQHADTPAELFWSITLYGFENNRVETIPGRGWWVWFRFYGPAEAFFDKSC